MDAEDLDHDALEMKEGHENYEKGRCDFLHVWSSTECIIGLHQSSFALSDPYENVNKCSENMVLKNFKVHTFKGW